MKNMRGEGWVVNLGLQSNHRETSEMKLLSQTGKLEQGL